jgi:hypothetical protein
MNTNKSHDYWYQVILTAAMSHRWDPKISENFENVRINASWVLKHSTTSYFWEKTWCDLYIEDTLWWLQAMRISIYTPSILLITQHTMRISIYKLRILLITQHPTRRVFHEETTHYSSRIYAYRDASGSHDTKKRPEALGRTLSI